MQIGDVQKKLLRLVDTADFYQHKGKVVSCLELEDYEGALEWCRKALDRAMGSLDPGATVGTRQIHEQNVRYLRSFETKLVDAIAGRNNSSW